MTLTRKSLLLSIYIHLVSFFLGLHCIAIGLTELQLSDQAKHLFVRLYEHVFILE